MFEDVVKMFDTLISQRMGMQTWSYKFDPRNATLNHECFENFDFVIPDLRVRNKVIHRLIVIVFA